MAAKRYFHPQLTV